MANIGYSCSSELAIATASWRGCMGGASTLAGHAGRGAVSPGTRDEGAMGTGARRGAQESMAWCHHHCSLSRPSPPSFPTSAGLFLRSVRGTEVCWWELPLTVLPSGRAAERPSDEELRSKHAPHDPVVLTQTACIRLPVARYQRDPYRFCTWRSAVARAALNG